MDITNPLSNALVEFQKTEPRRASKEYLGYNAMTVIFRKYKHY